MRRHDRMNALLPLQPGDHLHRARRAGGL